MRVARCAAAFASVVVIVGSGCSNSNSGDPCAPLPSPEVEAVLQLSCGAADLTTVAVSGPCDMGDTSPSTYGSGQYLYIMSPIAGACRVELTFATGFVSVTDITFFVSSTVVNCGTMVHFTRPTQLLFAIDNPSDTCDVDAGSDAGADGPMNAVGEAAADAEADADGSDAACNPITCASIGDTCAPQGDGCGGIVGPCGAHTTCTPPEYCGGGGYNKCGGDTGATVCIEDDLCVPITCTDIDCGLSGDGCGGLLECDPCPLSEESCVESECVWPADAGTCVPATCEGLGYVCGVLSDGCGGHLQCGTCPASQYCGGGGAHQCGGTCDVTDAGGPCEITCSSDAGGTCIGQSCEGLGQTCGEWPNGCGGLLDCGPCGGDAGATGGQGDGGVEQ
jgi:hypothetical protein